MFKGVNRKPLTLIVVLLLSNPGSTAQPSTDRNDREDSTVGVYLKTVTHDARGNLWVGGSVWLLQGFLLRINSSGTKVITPPNISSVERLLFTTKNVGWMIADLKVLFQSLDGGRSWREVLRSESNLTDITFPNERTGWVVGWHGVIYHTDNAGRSWHRQTNGIEIDLQQVYFVDATHGWAIGWNLLGTTDAGKTWKSIGDPSLSFRSIAFTDAQNGWAVVADDQHRGNVSRTNDGGVTWQGQSNAPRQNWETVFFLSKNQGWAIGDGIIRTTDSGNSWIDFSMPGGDRSYELASFMENQSGAAIHTGGMDTLTPGDIIQTFDGGLHWRALSNRWVQPTTDEVYRAKFPNLIRKKR